MLAGAMWAEAIPLGTLAPRVAMASLTDSRSSGSRVAQPEVAPRFQFM
jgi:hypothetical protein